MRKIRDGWEFGVVDPFTQSFKNRRNKTEKASARAFKLRFFSGFSSIFSNFCAQIKNMRKIGNQEKFQETG